ncbi:uncharacterized protein [Triticum aestivum]|uniref:uncharacterized protein n=1 Tax=Triticum aestivum TaxID=4565 RepID=UPI001D019082|nr:uncharacterized protein LOC123186817 [Triticum aestivum]
MRRILNLGLYDSHRRLYSLRRLDLLKINFFHPMAEQAAAHGKVLPTVLTHAEANTTRRRISSTTNLAAAEAAAPKIDRPKTELVIRPPQLDYSMGNHHTVHFLPTTSESKVVVADRGNSILVLI